MSAAQALGFAALLPSFPPEDWSLAATAAQLLADVGRPAHAVAIYRALLGTKSPPDDLRLGWVRPALAAARLAKDEAQVRRWTDLLAELAPPAPAP
jgi:hypothetical protein